MSYLQLVILLLLTLLMGLSFSANPPQGSTGAPGERTCASAGCHLAPNPVIQGKLNIRGLPPILERGVDYTLSLDMVVLSGRPERAGFQMVALTERGDDAAAFSDTDDQSTISMTSGRTYFEHDPAKNFEDKDTVTYDVTWNYTGDDSDFIILYSSANFADGNGSQTGDRIVTTIDTVRVAPRTDFAVHPIVTYPSCKGADGIIYLDVSGGTPPYQYEWFADQSILSADSTNSYAGLEPDSYVYTVIDSNNDVISGSVHLIEKDTIPPALSCLTDTITISSCTPLIYPVPTAVDECSPVTLRRVGGLGINQSFPQGITLEIYEATDTSSNISLCTIVVHNIIQMDASIDISNIACYEDSIGSVSVDVSGGTAPYTIATSIGEEDLSALPEGNHILIITDDTGCEITEEIEVRRPRPLSLEIEDIFLPISTTSGDGIINIDVNGGTPPYTYQWRTEDEDFTDEEDLSLLFPGVYYVIITDSRGCQLISDSITIDALTFVADIEVSDAIHLFPNPVSHFLFVDIEGSGQQMDTWRIHNKAGQTIVTSDNHLSPIDVSSLSGGIYLLEIETTTGKKGIQPFVKL